jgi:predicted unusual protein kinase regulating ubiquinone biosynthesis (AarF/ABC1/UbiB family)
MAVKSCKVICYDPGIHPFVRPKDSRTLRDRIVKAFRRDADSVLDALMYQWVQRSYRRFPAHFDRIGDRRSMRSFVGRRTS